jgi:two-component system CheB/CheR fusion protein
MTHFSRDPDWFAALFAWVPPLFEAKPAGEPVRVWVPACATGAETYSLVMVLLEYARTLKEAPPLQPFGTDLDPTAIQVARTGFYANAIKSHISEARLDRFFTKEP